MDPILLPPFKITGTRSMFDPSAAVIVISPHNLEPARSLVRKVKGRWRVYGLGTDVECSSDWPDDLIRYCDQGR